MTIGTYVDRGDARLAFEGPVLSLNTPGAPAVQAAATTAATSLVDSSNSNRPDTMRVGPRNTPTPWRNSDDALR